MDKFRALVVEEISGNIFQRNILEKSYDFLKKNDTLIKVYYTTLNFKDALSARGHKGITRNYPHIPGIDASGIIIESESDKFKSGDKVLVTGYDMGMNTFGGFSELISVPSEWIVPLPENISLREAMIFGTAGFTVGLSIDSILENNISPDDGSVLVTGATGGVGSLALMMLSKIGFKLIAATGKADKKDFLLSIGANEVISRDEVVNESEKPLLPKRWIAVLDNVGGITLSTAIRSTYNHGVVCAIGNTSSDKFSISVYPFILRGVRLIGIDSAETKMSKRLKIWQNISTIWKPNNLDLIVKEINLDSLSNEIDLMLQGKQCGKVLVKISDENE